MVFIGRYFCDETYYKSLTKRNPVYATDSAGTVNTIIQNKNGGGNYAMDFCMLFTIWLLYLVEFADWNSQSTIGYGGGDGKSERKFTGLTDNMPYHTGIVYTTKTTYGVGIQYRHIEDFWANAETNIAGCYISGTSTKGGMYIIVNPENFGEKSGQPLRTAMKLFGGTPSKFEVILSLGFPLFFPIESTGMIPHILVMNGFLALIFP